MNSLAFPGVHGPQDGCAAPAPSPHIAGEQQPRGRHAAAEVRCGPAIPVLCWLPWQHLNQKGVVTDVPQLAQRFPKPSVRHTPQRAVTHMHGPHPQSSWVHAEQGLRKDVITCPL